MKLIKILIAILFVVAIGCSSNKGNPIEDPEFYRGIAPGETQYDFSLPCVETGEINSNHSIQGMWDMHFDILSHEVSVNPYRSSFVHFNVTNHIPPPIISINDYSPLTNVIDVDAYKICIEG